MNQTWIILSLICAFSLASSDALAKKVLRPDNELIIAWLRTFLSLPALIVYLLLPLCRKSIAHSCWHSARPCLWKSSP